MVGTKPENIAACGGSYAEIKREILLVHSQTPDQIWRDLISIKQGEESFRQMCLRVMMKLKQFVELSQKEDESVIVKV